MPTSRFQTPLNFGQPLQLLPTEFEFQNRNSIYKIYFNQLFSQLDKLFKTVHEYKYSLKIATNSTVKNIGIKKHPFKFSNHTALHYDVLVLDATHLQDDRSKFEF